MARLQKILIPLQYIHICILLYSWFSHLFKTVNNFTSFTLYHLFLFLLHIVEIRHIGALARHWGAYSIKVRLCSEAIPYLGTTFYVSGVVNTISQIICNPLSPAYQLLNHPEHVTATGMARLFASLKKNILSLRSPNSLPSPLSSFPYVTIFRCPRRLVFDTESDSVGGWTSLAKSCHVDPL